MKRMLATVVFSFGCSVGCSASNECSQLREAPPHLSPDDVPSCQVISAGEKAAFVSTTQDFLKIDHYMKWSNVWSSNVWAMCGSKGELGK